MIPYRGCVIAVTQCEPTYIGNLDGLKLIIKSTVFFSFSRLAFVYESMVPDLMKLIEINQKKFKYICACVNKNLNTLISCGVRDGFVARTKNKCAPFTTYLVFLYNLVCCT